MRVCILASLSQKSDIETVANHYKKDGNLVDYPIPSRKNRLSICLDYIYKIKNADIIVAIPKRDRTFGDSVTYELAIAKYFDKPVVYKLREPFWKDDPTI